MDADVQCNHETPNLNNEKKQTRNPQKRCCWLGCHKTNDILRADHNMIAELI